MSTGDKGSTDCIVKNIFDTELGNDAGLIVGYTKFFCHLVASLWRKDICRFDGSVSEKDITIIMMTAVR